MYISGHDLKNTSPRCSHGDPQGHLITAHYIALKQDQSKFSWIHRIVDAALLSSCRWLLIENFSTLFNQFYMPTLHCSKVLIHKSRGGLSLLISATYNSMCVCSLFCPKKIHFKANIYIFLALISSNFWVRTLQSTENLTLYIFALENIEKNPGKVGYFSKLILYCPNFKFCFMKIAHRARLTYIQSITLPSSSIRNFRLEYCNLLIRLIDIPCFIRRLCISFSFFLKWQGSRWWKFSFGRCEETQRSQRHERPWQIFQTGSY
jgi:hypothetical protein